MFSGEALDKAKPVCEYVTQVYSAGCATLVENLKVKEIGSYAREKGMTIRKLLNKNGFDTSNLPKNTNIVTKWAFDDSNGFVSLFALYNYRKTYYNGINIDAKGATEQKFQIVDCGKNSWKREEWNHAVAGNTCVFKDA